MDNLILEALVRRLASDLVGRSLLRIDRIGEIEYLLRFASPQADNLRLRVHPSHPCFHRAGPRERPAALPPDPFCVLMSREMTGAALHRLAKTEEGDRVVEMVWVNPAGDRRVLMAELLGKSANLLLLDAHGAVLGYARQLASAFRAPVVGEEYRPPVPRRGFGGITWNPDRAREYAARFEDAGSTAAAIGTFLSGLSPPMGTDFTAREENAADPIGELEALLAAIRDGRFEPTLYTPVQPEEWLEKPALSTELPVLSPFPLRRPPLPVATTIPDPEQASRLFTALLAEQQETQSLRIKLTAILNRQERRLERLRAKLEVELAETRRAADHRRFGDLILAQVNTARVEGGTILLKDLFEPAAPDVRIPAEPGLTLPENAERHYGRARKLRRGAERIASRLESVRSSLDRLGGWRESIDRAANAADLISVEGILAANGIVPPGKTSPSPGPPTPAEGDPGIRKFRTEDGFVILVGRTSRDNDRLTFRVAAPHDFWLHAAERSGAHVVVRNPSRLKELPRPTLLAAARIAAHFSRARGKGEVSVHYTFRKFVRKGRGFGPGLVKIRNHRSVEVTPGVPGTGEDEG